MAQGLSLAVFVSGEGTTLDALASAVDAGPGTTNIRVVVADRDGARALSVAARHGIRTAVVRMRDADTDLVVLRLNEALPPGSVDLVVLAGLRSILPAAWLPAWRGRAINVHPSLLPRHGGAGQYGSRVYESVLAAGDRESGATVHLVTEAVDAGPTLLQERFPVDPTETTESLRAKTQAVERRLLVEAVTRFADGRWPLPYEPSKARTASVERRPSPP
jgi:phosphoribosylglycinamide formyltransferase-1